MRVRANTKIERAADAVSGSWVYSAPLLLQPFLKLSRLDRPIGTWLLLWPTLWGLLLAGPATLGEGLRLAALFAIGALVMRGAGCTYNDVVDRDLDRGVARTAARPLPAGEVSVLGALAWVVAQSLVGLAVLLQLNSTAIWVGLASLALVAAYPFMKRITYWPQAWLGLTFNWGVLVGYAAVAGALGGATLALYAGALFWTLGYDTIYAHQDREDDALIGVKSSALKLGGASRAGIATFYGMFLAGLVIAGVLANLSVFYYIVASAAAIQLGWQVIRLDINDANRCLSLFRSNATLGWVIAAALLAGQYL